MQSYPPYYSPEFSTTQLVLIFYFFLKYLGITLRINTEIAPIARFLHLLSGKTYANLNASPYYYKLKRTPNFLSDKRLIKELYSIEQLFYAFQLTELLPFLEQELRTAQQELHKSVKIIS